MSAGVQVTILRTIPQSLHYYMCTTVCARCIILTTLKAQEAMQSQAVSHQSKGNNHWGDDHSQLGVQR